MMADRAVLSETNEREMLAKFIFFDLIFFPLLMVGNVDLEKARGQPVITSPCMYLHEKL